MFTFYVYFLMFASSRIDEKSATVDPNPDSTKFSSCNGLVLDVNGSLGCIFILEECPENLLTAIFEASIASRIYL